MTDNKDWRDKGLDFYEQHRAHPTYSKGPMTPEQLAEKVSHLTNIVHLLVVLLIVNLLATLYVADFVHQIIQAVHSI